MQYLYQYVQLAMEPPRLDQLVTPLHPSSI
jgi:hypothetical protein